MPEKVVGILGGMGPEATLNCYQQLIVNTPAAGDQDHLRVVIVGNPKVPDRTRAILENGPSPLPVLIEGCHALERAGAQFIIIPCVTAHCFFEPLQAASPLPIVSILDVVAAHINKHHANFKTIGLMATSGTLQSGIFQERLKAAGFNCVTCSAQIQDKIMTAIYAIKSARPALSREAIAADLAAAAQTLVDKRAEGIIAGCTEIPLGLRQADVTVPYFDSLQILARAAIREAGRVPVEISGLKAGRFFSQHPDPQYYRAKPAGGRRKL
jgi:aspartate racemase